MKKKPNPKPTAEDRCIVCGAPYAHTHEIFFSNPDAALSQKYGLTVRLCRTHHTDHKDGVHHNREFDLRLKLQYKKKFEEDNPGVPFGSVFKTGWIKHLADYGLEEL